MSLHPNHIKTTWLLIACIFILLSGCARSKAEGFAIYLTKEDLAPNQMDALSHVEPSDQPIISLEDILSYDAETHEMELTDTAYERVLQMEVPVTGISFLVCVDKAPLYWGAFWTPFSSLSFDGVTILTPLSSENPKIITLTLGYPAQSFYKGVDPRNNDTVFESLDKAGKLVNKR
ncbi:MAG: hypothetical protein Q7I98_05900 [Erysipelotrichaceae bacterium]|nr:hypothetical protein [Erysipelotrichaceae bacterium]